MIKEISNQVEDIMKNALKKNSKEIEGALIKPLSNDYSFSTNGVYFFIGKMGSGKSFAIWKHIFTCERLNNKPYYDLILFCSTSGSMDKTSETFAKYCKTPIKYLKEQELLPFLTRHLRRKNKFYAIVKHVLTNFSETNEEMQRIIHKYSLNDIDDRIRYISMKLRDYGAIPKCDQNGNIDSISPYPFNTLLVLDDFAASPLLTKKDSPLIRMLTKTRHYNLTAIIVAQTIRFVPLNLKRMATDVIIYAKYSDEDFNAVLEQTPNGLNKKLALEEYRKLNNPHDHLIINITADKTEFVKTS